MSREIKFRAWNTGVKAMLHFSNPIGIADSKDRYGMFFKADEEKMYIGGSYEIMQYTGVKDNKRTEEYPEGQEIYEGDIVHVFGGEFCQGFWEHDEIITVKDIRYCWELGEFENTIVIGNIYESKEEPKC